MHLLRMQRCSIIWEELVQTCQHWLLMSAKQAVHTLRVRRMRRPMLVR